MSARPRFNRFRPFISLAQRLAGVGAPRREVVFSDRGLLRAGVTSSDGLALRLEVNADRLQRAGVAFDPKTAKAFALVPLDGGAWSRVELTCTDPNDAEAVVFSGLREWGDAAAAVWREGIAFGVEVPGYDATTTVWAQRLGENARPAAS